jgi:hypothetical protein
VEKLAAAAQPVAAAKKNPRPLADVEAAALW